MTTPTRTIAAVLTALTLAACGASSGGGPARPLAAPMSATDLVARLGCTDAQPNPNATGVKAEILCTFNGTDLTIDTFDTQQAQDTIVAAFGKLVPVQVLGKLWVVSVANHADAQAVVAKIGGRIA